mmetsp:Transcript_25461/g.73430  ORF Transcript_25461/g.73430 Transcript_25461/m.73430 type:complete len:214 (-) Transcript_25461:524-1165(-)
MKVSSVAVSRPPRLAGERNPSIAQPMETTAIARSCMPVPREAERRIGCCGGRKTSACTSFQPDSSARSSLSSGELYRDTSLLSVRIMIMATMPVSSRTIARELMIENQWIWSSPMYRYRSQRLAHLTSDGSHLTSYVYTTSRSAALPFGSTRSGGKSGPTGRVRSWSWEASSDQAPLYLCLTERGSTSNPTIRAPSNAASLWYLSTNRRWLCR